MPMMSFALRSFSLHTWDADGAKASGYVKANAQYALRAYMPRRKVLDVPLVKRAHSHRYTDVITHGERSMCKSSR